MDDSNDNDGVWIGVDFGTSNCACAVWDSNGGRAKWMRLRGLTRCETSKVGRVVPSAILFSSSTKVGEAAMQVLRQSYAASSEIENSDVIRAMILNVKRVLSNYDKDETLPFELEYNDKHEPLFNILPLQSSQPMKISLVDLISILLTEIRLAAQSYLDTQGLKKRLKAPVVNENRQIRNVVVGVPAHYSQKQSKILQVACVRAGFDGHVSSMVESTAAALAYGLLVSVPTQKSILVFDMGGGTTDITIVVADASRTQKVVVTLGDGQLGGNDMDEAFLEFVLKEFGKRKDDLTASQQYALLWSCRNAKEHLCKGGNQSFTISCLGLDHQLQVTLADFHSSIASLMERVRDLVNRAIERYHQTQDNDNIQIDEIVLVGGATRVPLVRQELQTFCKQQVCSTLPAEGAVAQGCAIQAALRSNVVPKHEIHSALMLDALPHAIGVYTEQQHFVEMLAKDATLPAMGHATFSLADPNQKGITVEAVEKVDGDNYPSIETFTFLLHRLTKDELAKLDKPRSVEIAMTMETSGKLVVSFFDWNDPHHLEKKHRWERSQQEGELGHSQGATPAISTQERVLMVVCGLLLVSYFLAKVLFEDKIYNGANNNLGL